MEEMNRFLGYAYSLASRLRDRQEDGLFAQNEEKCEQHDRRERKIEKQRKAKEEAEDKERRRGAFSLVMRR